VWRFHPRAEAGVRTERIQASHRLNGPGATLLSTEAGFNAYGPVRRSSLMLGYSLNDSVDLRMETGRETALGVATRFTLIRLVIRTYFLFPTHRP